MLSFTRRRLFVLASVCCSLVALAYFVPVGRAKIGDDILVPSATASVQFGSVTYTEDESQIAAITVTRTGDLSETTTVTFATSNQTAIGGAACISGVDYISVADQTVTFDPGVISQTVNVTICSDLLAESDQTVALALTGASVGAPGVATLTINDTATMYRNAAPITINNGGAASLYPSTINVQQASLGTGSIRVTLYDLSAAIPADVDVLLVDPHGQKFVVMGNAGGTQLNGSVTLNFIDTAGQVLPASASLTTGDFEPTTWGTIAGFPFSAPATPYNLPGSIVGGSDPETLFGSFVRVLGTNPNGAWSLYVRNDGKGPSAPAGAISGGWGLELFPTVAADALISGRVTTADGMGIRNARIVVTGNSLAQPKEVVTGSFGYYSIDGLQAGETYVVTIQSKRFTFPSPSRVINLVDSVSDADFVAAPVDMSDERVPAPVA